VRFVTLLLRAFLFCLHSAVLQVSKSVLIVLGQSPPLTFVSDMAIFVLKRDFN